MPEDSTYDENNLLTEIATGDEQAFEMLFSNYRGRIFNYLLRITKFPEVAEELTMDIFLKLWVGRDLLRNIKNPDAFLFKVAHNKAVDFFRTASRHKRLHELYANHIQHLHNVEQPVIAENEILETLTKIINGLPPRRKLIYKLSREENMTYEQIADYLNLSQKTVKNAMLSALKDIRRQLGIAHKNTNVILNIFLMC